MNIREFIKDESEYFAPILQRLSTVPESSRQSWRLETVHERRSRVSLEVYDMNRGIVNHGPFKGMQLSGEPSWGRDDLGSMVMGFYEKEILDWVEQNCSGKFTHFVDVGAADGYYAVGLVGYQGFKSAVCFEINEGSHEVIRENAKLNNCSEKISICGEASFSEFQKIKHIFNEDCLILCDIEGGEFALWDVELFETCKRATIIIEVHHWVENFPEKYENFLTSASRFFDISIIPDAVRDVNALSELRELTDDNRYLLLSERRPAKMRFLLMQPRHEK